MKKSRIVQDLACFTIILTLLSLLVPGCSLAARNSYDHGNGSQNQYMHEDTLVSYNETDNMDESSSSESDVKQEQKNLSTENRSEVSEYKQERKQFENELQLHKQEYNEAKENFLKIKDRIRAKELDSNSEEAVNATKSYLNSSINYMIAHLSNVESNMEYSNGNETNEKVTVIDEKIRLLEVEKLNVANASSQGELLVVVRSVRGIWNDAEKISLSSAGQTVSEKIGEFLEKSESLSERLGVEIKDMKETGIDTSELEIKLASYISYIKSAQEKKVMADSLYSGENVTREDMRTANNYLRQSLNDISKANKLLREIFVKLKNYETEENGTKARN
ncbi:chromosome segregation ATPase [Methanosarcina spelaei]|uniref:Chromosome segregation ATPase n=1 Tax=Methanosarcina spelaei TaxID=1036679 RepID=A0A2A2HR84_9EURY|nr:chromosome segregation ATPase [Methanosarcina spelaei]PAV11882.1 chromosome segregation ATPase [Methanosarcina spelaei]